jgi:cytochrome b pre-mRNA-processing protein 3
MLLKRFFQRKPDAAQLLYEGIVAAARHPRFYAEMGVPDSLDGRFDMICLHLYLVLARLKGGGQEEARQSLTDAFFRDMDRSLREMGVGDLSVAKKVRKMAEVFYGRVAAYEAAREQGGDAMTAALRRNVFGGDAAGADNAARIAAWVEQASTALASQNAVDLASGRAMFP